MTCVNNQEMADRCKVKDANRVVYSVKATAQFNSQIYLSLRSYIRNRKLVFPVHEDDDDLDDVLSKLVKGYSKMTDEDKQLLRRSYIETTLLQLELIKLKTITNGNMVAVKEPSNGRKDRCSSIAYGAWLANQLEIDLKPSYRSTQSLLDKFKFHRASYIGGR